ncbi:MAG: hypothetical protein A2509_12425 [Candidatus Edwardsbacteria bacterium RIFOXYD12_FULL_50_11]|uniref:Outer membrane protein beta-barrel domain-containing protein n=1 Tax=Candidatus Edwardsbacteria bacterium GWF2_54_11 TaxID=1817851 RepID=A0A1F5RIL0_9BACT|nr:MAG: hypothetical protein A2502_04835 [Candidatus Edwardsbacteria bacterium RifOxyC12_full_54_24]OGF08715.1 MAG: hypothetical protein A2273_07215 [Candidatus Edwardsbacteria bacterium RifOxyA12_full_54_48]OGF12308.1 MAG: hypothetical protein A3K15_00390 [Candidatus Edwardsbacteria bacterium GWE2_54_12]OGF14347.1 MAG: hypothetical protein A2024_10185 [Candidatus Edwardsbacteria bacterium GWF2_54_11]OGF15786.1 MAG: hypothetical protein A2509_12425 [Candidatus Edwardsbacteria bacterium RIFOXYD1
MKYKPIFILLIMIIFANRGAADEGRYISPGIKFGYTFGEGGGVTVGAEVSYIVWYNNLAHAAVLNLDICGNEDKLKFNKIHLGYQISRGVGIEAGPTMFWTDKGMHFGASVTPFAGIIIPYAYYSITVAFNKKNMLNEAGILLKLPIPVPGHEFSIGLN